MRERDLPRNTGSLADDFRDCIQCLNAHAVVYILVGAYAVGWHGVVRATGDIDFLYQQTPDNVHRLCAALREYGAPPHLIDREFLLSPDAVTQIGTAPLRVDLLASLTGVTFEEVLVSSIPIELDGERLRVIGLDALRKNKQATGRRKDRSDLRDLPRESSPAPGAGTAGSSHGRRGSRARRREE